MQTTGLVESRSQETLAKIGLLAIVATLCSGCPTPHSSGPEGVGFGGPSPSGGGLADVTTVEPGLPLEGSHDLRPQIVEPTVEQWNSQVHDEGLLVDIFFDFDRSELTPAARADLERNARFLRRAGEVRLLIEGHCDERGTNEYNLALGHLRARTARDYLIRLGIAAERLESISYGEERGVCQASSEGCWARNRRAYLRIVGRG